MKERVMFLVSLVGMLLVFFMNAGCSSPVAPVTVAPPVAEIFVGDNNVTREKMTIPAPATQEFKTTLPEGGKAEWFLGENTTPVSAETTYKFEKAEAMAETKLKLKITDASGVSGEGYVNLTVTADTPEDDPADDPTTTVEILVGETKVIGTTVTMKTSEPPKEFRVVLAEGETAKWFLQGVEAEVSETETYTFTPTTPFESKTLTVKVKSGEVEKTGMVTLKVTQAVLAPEPSVYVVPEGYTLVGADIFETESLELDKQVYYLKLVQGAEEFFLNKAEFPSQFCTTALWFSAGHWWCANFDAAGVLLEANGSALSAGHALKDVKYRAFPDTYL